MKQVSAIFEFSARGREDFLGLPKNIRKRIEEKMRFFMAAKNPLDYGNKLTNTNNKFRFRIGDYRVIVEKRRNKKLVVLLVLRVGHRKEIYR